MVDRCLSCGVIVRYVLVVVRCVLFGDAFVVFVCCGMLFLDFCPSFLVRCCFGDCCALFAPWLSCVVRC